MHRRFFILVLALWALLPVASASARLWESRAEIEKRYGRPIKTTGYPDRRAFIYAFKGLEIRIKFFNGISEAESYSPSEKQVAFGDAEIQRLLESNSDGGQWRKQGKNDWVIDARKGRAYADVLPDALKLRVYTHASIERPDKTSHAGTLKEETLQGVATLRKEEEISSLVVATGNLVIYIPWSEGRLDRGFGGLIIPGKTYRFTLRDDESVDEDESVAYVSDRDHKDYSEAVDDSKRYLLVRVQDGDNVIFDRSVCELHHITMSEILANYGIGMHAPSPDDQCVKNFPHASNFLSGDCIIDPAKNALIYVCPKCVDACERSKR